MTKEELEQLNQIQFAQIALLLKQIKELNAQVEHLEKLLTHEPVILQFPNGNNADKPRV